MNEKDGGYIIPHGMEQQLLHQSINAVWWMGHRPSPRVLTFRERLRARYYGARWWLHDRLFPSCYGDGDG